MPCIFIDTRSELYIGQPNVQRNIFPQYCILLTHNSDFQKYFHTETVNQMYIFQYSEGLLEFIKHRYFHFSNSIKTIDFQYAL